MSTDICIYIYVHMFVYCVCVSVRIIRIRITKLLLIRDIGEFGGKVCCE